MQKVAGSDRKSSINKEYNNEQLKIQDRIDIPAKAGSFEWQKMK
jgi:hypothetical protein